MFKDPKASWHMKRALRLAKKGMGFVLPNPMVGAVLVKDGKRIGEGYHQNFGGPHAEILALESCETSPQGATLYVTLEPCSHHGKTPPCTEALIEAGIEEVIIASKDPLRQGIETLSAAGIECHSGLLEDQARELNRAFFTFHEKQRPYITLKWAMSLDAKLSESSQIPTQLTGPLAQKLTHVMRHEHHGILVGANTIRVDDPELSVRRIEGKDPLRLIWKGSNELPKEAKVFRDDHFKIFESQSLEELLHEMHQEGILSVLVEGGPKVLEQFLNTGVWDELHCFIAPQCLGSQAYGFEGLTATHGLNFKNVRQCGQDLLISARHE